MLAHAIDQGGKQQIQVSSALWERIATKEPIAGIILTHEMAHLFHRDIPAFRLLESIVITIRNIIKFIFLLGLALTAIVALYQIVSDIHSRKSWKTSLYHLAGVPFVSMLVLAPMLFGALAIRRYGGFLASLMELRADTDRGRMDGRFPAFHASYYQRSHRSSSPLFRHGTILGFA